MCPTNLVYIRCRPMKFTAINSKCLVRRWCQTKLHIQGSRHWCTISGVAAVIGTKNAWKSLLWKLLKSHALSTPSHPRIHYDLELYQNEHKGRYDLNSKTIKLNMYLLRCLGFFFFKYETKSASYKSWGNIYSSWSNLQMTRNM